MPFKLFKDLLLSHIDFSGPLGENNFLLNYLIIILDVFPFVSEIRIDDEVKVQIKGLDAKSGCYEFRSVRRYHLDST